MMKPADPDLYETLQQATKENTPAFRVRGIFLGKIVDVYDGDTCRLAVAAERPGQTAALVEYLNVRMLGYDAPEMKKDHKPYGTEVRDVLRELVLDKIVIAHAPETKKPDPYGRVLARLYVAERGVSFTMPYAPPWWKRCFPKRGQDEVSTVAVTAADETGSARETVTKTVRDVDVAVPCTTNVPNEYGFVEEHLADFLYVNQWMVDHAKVKPYDGVGARPGYTSTELRDGYQP